MNRSPEEVATVRRNILLALLAAMRVYSSADSRVDLLLNFYASTHEEQERIALAHRLLRPARQWEEDRRFELEKNLGLYMSQGANCDLNMDQMTDMGRMVRRVLTLDDPEEANGNLESLASRSDNWGADGNLFLQKYRELTAAA